MLRINKYSSNIEFSFFFKQNCASYEFPIFLHWELVTVEYKDDNTELVDYYPLPDERYVALAQKTPNGNNNGCLILDHAILKDTAYVRIQEILSEYNNKGSD